MEISCLDVYARHTFSIALREIKRKFSIWVAANPTGQNTCINIQIYRNIIHDHDYSAVQKKVINSGFLVCGIVSTCLVGQHCYVN